MPQQSSSYCILLANMMEQLKKKQRFNYSPKIARPKFLLDRTWDSIWPVISFTLARSRKAKTLSLQSPLS